jgi:hypothetical protein
MLTDVAAARGSWAEVDRLAGEVEKLVTDNPTLGFCLVGGTSIAWGSVARALGQGSVRETLEPYVARMVPESVTIQASLLFLPTAMVGSDRWLADSRGAFQAGTQFWNRQQRDPFGVNLTIGLAVLERWEEVESRLATFERVALRGGRLCRALSDAVLEERAASQAGPPPRHETLRELGFTGLSELLSFRSGRSPQSSRPGSADNG